MFRLSVARCHLLYVHIQTPMPEYTMNEVERHCTADDLWIVYNGKVYDLTSYYPMHPGTTAMLRQAGKDASSKLPFVSAHGFAWTTILKKLDECYVGDLKQS